jgi:acetylornithine deacetylase/succinyl-diaminopimelate desuccinylase-like protein
MIWSRPTCEVNGITGGYTGDGFKTVLPSKASAKISFRLVGDAGPAAIRESFRAMVRATRCPPIARWSSSATAPGPPAFDISDPAVREGARGAERRMGANEAAFIGCGGSIPVAGHFKTSSAWIRC